MKKSIFTLFCFVFTYSAIFSQSNPLDKKMEKAYSLVEKGKITDAEEYMEKLLEKNPEYGDGWDYLGKIRYKLYKDAKSMDNLFGGNVTVTTKDKDGKEVKQENDTLGNKLLELLTSIKPSKKAFNKYIYTLRLAILNSNDAHLSSQMLRNYFVDDEKDTAVSRKALKYFNEAEDDFAKKNYEAAAKSYKRAIDEQPDFYKAALYMGDCFYFSGNYIEAIRSFESAVKKFPNDLEARKYLIDAYFKEKLYDRVLENIITALTVYPDQSVAFAKMDDALYYNYKKLDIKWIPRGVLPNKIDADSLKQDLNEYKPEKEAAVKQPWDLYRKSQKAIAPFCNDKGIITKPNTLTKSDYMEVYGWEEMLKNSKDPSLDEAKRMQKDGYLDCYALVTCFHFDFYDQYVDFVSKNKERVIAYYNKYIVAGK